MESEVTRDYNKPRFAKVPIRRCPPWLSASDYFTDSGGHFSGITLVIFIKPLEHEKTYRPLKTPMISPVFL